MEELEIRKEIVRVCLEMERLGINQGTSGNVSHRLGEGMLITPSGVPYGEMTPEDLVFVPFEDKKAYKGKHPPSSELDFHFDILKAKKDVNAVLHNHSTYATAVAMCREDIPPCHYMVAVTGGKKIPCAKYATFGTKELSENILDTLNEGYNSCLLANHGVLTTAKSLKKALWLAVEIESAAKQYIFAKQLSNPVVLDDKEMDKILEKFKNYGLKKS
ncbi:MAG: class II aldolase [Epsilonproteobacteria bacterium]|nr:class II aldolase [Campylobacterota bacterium]